MPAHYALQNPLRAKNLDWGALPFFKQEGRFDIADYLTKTRRARHRIHHYGQELVIRKSDVLPSRLRATLHLGLLDASCHQFRDALSHGISVVIHGRQRAIDVTHYRIRSALANPLGQFLH